MGMDQREVKAWMRAHRHEYEDARTGEIGATQLAEAAADAFDANGIGGPLDDPDHWIWDLAVSEADGGAP